MECFHFWEGLSWLALFGGTICCEPVGALLTVVVSPQGFRRDKSVSAICAYERRILLYCACFGGLCFVTLSRLVGTRWSGDGWKMSVWLLGTRVWLSHHELCHALSKMWVIFAVVLDRFWGYLIWLSVCLTTRRRQWQLSLHWGEHAVGVWYGNELLLLEWGA